VTEARDDGKNSAGARSPHNSAAPASAGTWVGAWAAAPVGGEPGTEQTGMAGRSVRNVVHTSAGGTGARITLSNLYGQPRSPSRTPRSPSPPAQQLRRGQPAPCAG
jgi:hypothetical protein